jgi:hypothetical protein
MEISTLKNNLNNIRMKKIQLTGLTILLLFVTVVISAQSNPPEQLTVVLSNPGKPYTLKLGLLNGSIKVSGYGGKDIVVEVSSNEKNKTAGTEDAGNGMKRIFPGSNYEVTAREEDNVVFINSDHNKHISLILKIPQDVKKLIVSTVNDGIIEIDNVKGELEVNNVNGAIRLTNISGSAVASTVNGEVLANFNSVDASAAMAFTTLNGTVDVTFPANAKSNLKLKSDRGEIFTDFDVVIEKSAQGPVKITESGMQKLRLDDWIMGKINGGGPQILMKNMNGNIYLRKTKS